MYRVEWIRHQEREKKKLEDEKEKERGWFSLPLNTAAPHHGLLWASLQAYNVTQTLWQ